MSKTLNCTSSTTLYKSLSDIFGTDKETIERYVIENFRGEKNLWGKGEVNLKKFFKYLDHCGIKDSKSKIFNIDDIVIAHVSSRISIHENGYKELKNLYDLLSSTNSLTSFFKKYEIEFFESGDKIEIFYKGARLIIESFFKNHGDGAARRIKMRLQGNSVYNSDYCINGFLFGGEIYENGNIRHLMVAPEIVQDIAKILSIPHMEIEWREKAERIIIGFKVGIKDIIFDENVRQNNKQKKSRLMREILIYLAANHKGNWEQTENIIIRLKEKKSIPNEDFEYVKVID